ncbi:MAG: hypothetical protein M1826_007514 [Phylliscum demangeonii]|nr:MAG: hypothetical protein M1826_007514 [Phylliscum demangeonii]
MAPRFNIPPLTRLLLAALLILSFLTGALRYRQWARKGVDGQRPDDTPASAILVPYLTIVPQLSLFYPWVLLTSTLVESNLFGLVITLVTIFYGGRYLERAWSSAEFGKFLLIVSIVSNVVASAIYVAWYAVTGDIMRSLTTVAGGVALQAAFLVAFKQLVPEHTVTIAKGVVKMRVKHFPALFVLCATVAGVVLRLHATLILAWMGFLTSWIYLRFYRFSPDVASAATGRTSGIRGDASESFAFAAFFPDPLSAPVAAVSARVYQILVTIRICTPFSPEDVETGNEQAHARGEAGLPSLLNGAGRSGVRGGGKREEAERRRALALKALDQRLHAATNRAPGVAPGLSLAPPEQSAAHEGQDEGASRSGV